MLQLNRMKYYKEGRLLISLALFLCFSTFCFFSIAYAATTTIKGKVTCSKTSLPIANAKVSIYNIKGILRLSANTDSAGNYTISYDLKSAAHIRVRVESAGFASKSKSGIILPGKTYTYNFALISADRTPPSGSIRINNDAQYTNSVNVTLNLSAQDNSGGSGLAQMKFCNNNSSWSTPEAYTTTKSWTLSSGDGTKTVYVKFMDVAGNWSAAYHDTIILDTTAPNLPTINAVTSPTNINSQTITGTKSADTAVITVVCATATAGTVAYSTLTTYSCALTNLTEGANAINVTAKDAAGNTTTSVQTGIILDTIVPTGTININNGVSTTTSTSVTLNLSAQDNTGGTGLSQMQFSNDNSTWSTPETYATTKAWVLSSGVGTKTVYVKFSDIADNWSSVYSGTITLISPPQTPVLNHVYKIKNSTTQVLTGAKAAGSSICINNTEVAPLNSFNTWFYEQPLAMGTNNLCVTSKDASGNPSQAVNLSVNTQTDPDTLDIAPPMISGMQIIPPNIKLKFQDPPGVLTYRIYYIDKLTDPAWHLAQEDYPTTGTGTTYWTDDGSHTGIPPLQTSQRFYKIAIQAVETIPPTGSVSINNGDAYTNSISVTLNLLAQDNAGGSGLSQMQFSNDNVTWSTPEAYATTKAWQLTDGTGLKTVYVKFKDRAGNWSAMDSATITVLATLDISYSYDSLNRLNNISYGGKNTTYNYDEAGNIVTETTTGN